MNTREEGNHLLSTMRRKVLLIILIILIAVEIILYIFINTEEFKEIDITITKYLQKNIFEEKPTSVPILLEIVHILNDMYSPYVLISIIYNFFTVYDCFLLVNILSVDYILSFLLKLIYNKPSYNYFKKSEENEIIIFYCGYGWAFPSEEIIITLSMYLSIWKIICKLSFKFTNKKIIVKNIFLILILLIFSFFAFCTLLTGYYFFSHIVFSFIMGIIVYLIFFESNFFDLLNGEEFMTFIIKYNLLYIIINLSLFVIFTIIYIIERKTISEKNKYDICKTIDGVEQFNMNGKFNSYLDGTFCFNVLFLANVFAAVGIQLDLKYIYKNNDETYYQMNFPQEFQEIIDNKSKVSFDGSIHITQEIAWNKTHVSTTLLRLILVLVFCWTCFLPYIFVFLKEDHDILLILCIKIFLPPVLFFLGIFFYLKPLLKIMNLTNVTYNSISDDI